MKSHLKRNWLWYLITVLLMIGNLYFYASKKWSEQQAKIKLDESMIECNDKIATVTEQNHLGEIKAQGSFYASLVREGIYEKSWSTVRNSLENIVRETMITRVDYVSADGDIEISTNKRLEGDAVGEDIPKNLFGENTSVHAYRNNEGYLLSVPVYVNNMYLGRLLMQHSTSTSNVAPR